MVDAWKRVLELGDMFGAMGALTSRQRDCIEKAVLICEPVAVATDRVQSDMATAVILLQVYTFLYNKN